MENSLTCMDCHGTDKPVAKAKESICQGCHGDMTDAEWVVFIDGKGKKSEHSPHNSHEAPIDCTECHSMHKPSKLYCNKCHNFTNKVP